MNILLIGEYSRLHNSLKEGLQKLGHHVVIFGFKDGFKDFPVDFPIEKKWDSGFLKKIKVGIFKLTGFNISSYLTYLQFKKNKNQFVNFDVVQLINENSFYCGYHFEKKILEFLFKNNKKVYLLSCGTDYLTVKYSFENPEIKSLIQPYLEGKINNKNFQNVLKFRKKSSRKLHEFIYKNISGIIASDMDYHIPLRNNPKYLGLIPNPINVENIEVQPFSPLEKIIIFHGINTENYFKKGNDYFEKALAIIQNKYNDRVEIITTRNIPYQQYIQLYNKAHILLDQVYCYDQGYNALEAMAKGKVVFTGAEKEFEAFYNLKESVNVNAKPDVNYLVESLSYLIENPEEISIISKRARMFVEKEHDYIQISKRYLSIWNQ
ncbi:glycosyltransferase family protein [Flavobacterium psychrotolerans]|uniref:Glycosyl transferase family 1 n=1 Tax=Flavobacterium psychrotolerans TaxID=2169410 RepID=A0A2U1JQE4_9FLAO|nr:glycosyltransferase [Flavobacterium psychrotolerans]PWA07352.1 glycosyl transferase family 1 [Flavobacterium psychrotolerans]